MTARRAIVAMAGVPALALAAGVLCPANRPKDVIPVSTLCLLFPVLPALLGAAVLAPRLVPAGRPSWGRVARAAALSVAALLVAGDFWLIGVYGGQKGHGLVSVPVALALVAWALAQARPPAAPPA